jgi:cytoskeletal protein CcmA (bactofilin family)
LTGDASGTAATVTGAAQSAITSVGTLTSIVIADAGNIGSASDTDAIAIASDGKVTFTQEIIAPSLDISGSVDVDGTLEADAYTVDGTTLDEYIADTIGAMVGSNTETGIAVTYEDGDNTLDFVIGTLNQDTSGTADNITVTANNSTDETVYPIFVDGATGSQGAESDTGLTYNPSTGLLTSTGFSGNLTGTLQTAAQGNVTSVGTLTSIVIADAANIGSASDTDAIAIASDGKVTFTQEVIAPSLDISGSVDIDGTLEADAYTVDGTTLDEYIADTVGAMVSSNTETGITVTYQDGDNTLDFAIGTLNQDTSGTADNITVTANNSTDETVYPIFVDGTTGSQGAESDSGLTYNPSTGLLTSTAFAGNIDGALGGSTPAAASVTTLAVSGAISGASFKDEDNMASDSATAVASQQSIKAYVDGLAVAFAIALG